MKRGLVIFCLAIMVTCAGVAHAQDQFKGFYVGSMLGWTSDRGQYGTSTVFSPTGYFATTSVPAIENAGTMPLDSNGFVFTAHAGYNWRFWSHGLIGLEANGGALYLRDFNNRTALYPCCAPTGFTIRSAVNTNWMFTAGPRIGYTAGNWLYYATAGLAVTDVSANTHFTDTFATANETGRVDENKLGWMVGGGLEYRLAEHWAARGEYMYADFGSSDYTSDNLTAFTPPIAFPTNVFTHSYELRTHMLRGGVSYYFHNAAPKAPAAASCSASPAEVMTGEPVTVTASPSNFDPKHTLAYSWTSNGGKVSGTEASAKVDTTGMAAGNYSATAHVTDPKNKKMMADCTANFAVKEPPKNPPQVSCSANPQTVQSGSASTISCTCTSPDGAQLQPLAWQASQGKIAGEGNTATLDTAGLESGAVTVTTTCTDARGLSSSATTNVNVEKPVVINPSKINECAFPNKVKPARVDNTCKAALDDVALRLQREADAKAVIVGEMDAKEKKNTAAERALNTKGYLVNEKQIDGTRLETRTGSDGGQRVEIWLVPAGSTAFDQPGTTVVNAPTPKPMKKGTKKAAKKPAQ